MAKLVFPGVGAPYRGFIGEVRGWLNRIASYVENSPGAISVINSQLDVLAAETGFMPTLPSTQAIVSNGQKITGVTGSGTVANITVNPTTKVVTVALSAS